MFRYRLGDKGACRRCGAPGGRQLAAELPSGKTLTTRACWRIAREMRSGRAVRLATPAVCRAAGCAERRSGLVDAGRCSARVFPHNIMFLRCRSEPG